MSYEVELKHIEKYFGSFKAADDASFGVEKGQLAGLLGPSGSGKTTLLRMLAGLEQPDKGDIWIAGRRVNKIPARERGIGFVFQNYALFRHMTVRDNLAFGLRVQKVDGHTIKVRTDELLELTGLTAVASVIRSSFPAVSGSGWPLRGLWHQIPRFCCSMSRLQPLMLRYARNSEAGCGRRFTT